MPTNTTKLNLVKPLKSEKYNVDVFNGNADIIDSQIYSKSEVDTSLGNKVDKTTTVNSKALSSNITINAGDVPNTPSGNISATNVQNAINELDTEKANRVQEPWITPTLVNGATSVSGQTVQYMKDQFGFVHLRGMINVNSLFTTCFILPLGYRPEREARYVVSSNNNYGMLRITVNGDVLIAVGAITNIQLDDIKFRAI